MAKISPTDIRQEYEKGKTYNSSIDLYTNVEKNERFYSGDHWKGIDVPDGMLKPIFNFTKRVVAYFISMLVTDDIGVSIEPFEESIESTINAKTISKEVEKNMERNKLKSKMRDVIRDAAVDGDSAIHFYFDSSIDTKHVYEGDINCEILPNTRIMFGNPYCNEINKQPYILVIQRLNVEQVREYAKNECGIEKEKLGQILSDSDNLTGIDDDLTTVITKYYFKDKTIHVTKVCCELTLKEEKDLGYKAYPIAYMSWEKVKESYHGKSPITGMIPNQIFINKLFAMSMIYVTANGFPKVLYDTEKFKKLTNNVGEATGVKNLELLGKVIDGTRVPDFSAQVPQMIEMVMSTTRDCMGANDAALGNVKADNTSAIVALQNASAVPLELQKLAYYDFIEDSVRIMIEMMSVHYGIRQVKIGRDDYLKLNPKLKYGEDNMEIPLEQFPNSFIADFDFKSLANLNYDLNIDIGSSSYWSEVMQINTLDNLVAKNILTDAITYLEAIPDKFIKNKGKIIESIKEKQEEQRLMQQQMMLQGTVPTQPM